MKKTIFLFLFIIPLLAQGQIKSEWKLFTAGFAYDGDYKTNVRIGNQITAFTLDKRGNIWAGVPGFGLRMYNGETVVNISPKEVKLLTPKIRALACDSKNNIWVGTNKGLLKFNGTEWTEFDPEVQENMMIKSLNEIAIDAQDNVWITGFKNDIKIAGMQITGAGISKWDGSKWTHYNKIDNGIPDNFGEDLTFDKEGNLWLAAGLDAGEGVAKFDGSNWSFMNKKNSDLPANEVRAIEVDHDGNVWFGTPNGLAKYVNGKFETSSLRDLFSMKFLNYMNDEPDILSMAIEKNGTIWMGTKGEGVIKIQDGKKMWITQGNSPLTSNYVRDIFIDDENRKWFVTGFKAESVAESVFGDKSQEGFYGGIVTYKEPNPKAFPGWDIYHNQNTELPSARFSDVEIDPNGKAFFTSGSTITTFDGKDWAFFRSEAGSKLLGDNLNNLTLMPNGDLYITANKGLRKFDGSTFIALDKKQTGIGNYALSMTADDAGNLWIGNTQGVFKYDGKTSENFNKKSADLPSNTVYSVFQDSKKNIWIGTAKGAGFFDGKAWTFYSKNEDGLPANRVESITEDKDGNIWIGTPQGVAKFEGGKWKSFKKISEDIPWYRVTTIKADAKGNLWVGTENKGLLKYDGASWSQFNDENSAVVFNNVSDIEFASDGTLWLCLTKATTMGMPTVPGQAEAPAPATNSKEGIEKQMENFDPSSAVLKVKL